MTKEEAIEVYNGLINQKIKEAFEFFAPELAESEDERIRKHIIEILKRLGPCHFDGNERSECIAWLEKQKDNTEKEYVFRPLAGTDITDAAKHAIERAKNGDHLVLAFNGMYTPVSKYDSVKGLVDKYNTYLEEQKPSEQKIKIPKFRVGDIIISKAREGWEKPNKIAGIQSVGYITEPVDTYGGGFIGFSFEDKYELYEQKPVEKKEIEKTARISPGLLSNFGTSTYVLDVDFTQEEKEKLNLAGFSNGTIKIKILCE